MEVISKFKILSGLNDEPLISAIWEQAQSVVLELTNRKEFVIELEAITLDIAVIMSNRLGTEGETSRTEGGISISFDDLPYSLQCRISNYRLAKVGGRAFEKKKS
jgi:hypothetical protein